MISHIAFFIGLLDAAFGLFVFGLAQWAGHDMINPVTRAVFLTGGIADNIKEIFIAAMIIAVVGKYLGW